MTEETSASTLRTQVLDALRQVIDPELGVNIVDLGLIYGVEVTEGQVRVKMTMTTPACPMEELLTSMAHSAVMGQIPNVRSVEIDLVWDPPWQPKLMSDAAKFQLGWTTG